jgi:hypothetical protein
VKISLEEALALLGKYAEERTSRRGEYSGDDVLRLE